MAKRPVPEAKVGPTGFTATDRPIGSTTVGLSGRSACSLWKKIEELRAEGHPGSTGENITTKGLDWARLTPGTRLQLGDEVRIEITSYTVPCKNIAGSFAEGRFARISPKLHPGDTRLYAKVLQEGEIRIGDAIRFL